MPESKPKSAAEKYMAATMDFLLALPDEERRKMEQASRVPFTMDKTAPETKVTTNFNQMVCTVQIGTMEAAEVLLLRGLNPCALNFAHSYNCGGGFEHANGSQEEALFRTSSLFLSLWPHRRVDDGPGVLARGMWIGNYDDLLPRKEAFYPYSLTGGIYSPYVKIVRKVAKGRDAVLWKPEEMKYQKPMGVVSVAAQDVPRDGYFDEQLLREKCRTALHVAVKNGHDSVVLGAFGCGYFDNPPDVVADTFSQLLFGEFKNAFKIAMFAIPDRAGENLDEFTRVFPLLTVPDIEGKMNIFRRFSTASEEAAFLDTTQDEDVSVKKKGIAGGYQRGRGAAPKRGNRNKKKPQAEEEKKAAEAAAAQDEEGSEMGETLSQIEKKKKKKDKKEKKGKKEKTDDDEWEGEPQEEVDAISNEAETARLKGKRKTANNPGDNETEGGCCCTVM